MYSPGTGSLPWRFRKAEYAATNLWAFVEHQLALFRHQRSFDPLAPAPMFLFIAGSASTSLSAGPFLEGWVRDGCRQR